MPFQKISGMDSWCVNDTCLKMTMRKYFTHKMSVSFQIWFIKNYYDGFKNTNLWLFFFSFQTELRTCQACNDAIADKYFLEVGGCSWHGSCLRCCVCSISLDRQPSCFQRERQVYCKADYAK